MLKIAPSTMQALHAAAARDAFGRFARWWPAHALPPLAPDALARLWRFAGERGAELGIEDDERGQLSLYAAAQALMPDPTVPEFMAVTDLLFDPRPLDERLAEVIAMARTRGTAH